MTSEQNALTGEQIDRIEAEGYRASIAADGDGETKLNPYDRGTHEYEIWLNGFYAACEDLYHEFG